MRFIILLAFIGFNLSVPLLIDNNNLINSKDTSSTIDHKNMVHEHNSHNHAEAKTPCEDSSESLVLIMNVVSCLWLNRMKIIL